MPEPNPMLTDTRLDTRIAAFFQKEGDPPWDEEAPSQYEDCLRFVAEIEARLLTMPKISTRSRLLPMSIAALS
jgi:hypothetical protein